MLTWFYVTGLMLLLGAEVNAEIENAAAKRGIPDAKHKGQKVPAADKKNRPHEERFATVVIRWSGGEGQGIIKIWQMLVFPRW